MTKNLLTTLLLLFINFSIVGQNNTTIENLLKKENLSGAVWTTIQKDSIAIFSAGFKNLTTKDKLTTTDKIHVGSITKTVLALGVLMLATESKLKIDNPIKKYLPKVPIQNPWEKTNPITIRHLLDHTSGLSDLRLWHFFSSTAQPKTPLSEFYTQNPEVLKVRVKPGHMFSYSNMGYTLLGMLIEKVTNRPYEEYLDEHLLKQIGMIKSTFQFTSQEGAYKAKDLAMGHFDNGTIAPALPIYLRPAGQFTTTASDMGLLMRFVLNKGKVRGNQIIDSAYFENYGKPIYTTAFKNGLHNGYSFGISLRDRNGVTGLAHSGNIIGYRAMLYIFPNENKGFFISHNMDSETADYEAFNKLLIDNLGITKTQSIKIAKQRTNGLAEWEGYYVPKIVKVEPLGLFDVIGSFTKIKLNKYGLTVSPFQKKEIELNYIGNNLFQVNDRLSPSHLFYSEGGEKYFTSGISTLKKINGSVILFIATSFILGLVGVVIALVSGFYQILRYKFGFLRMSMLWVFSGILILLLAAGFIASKNIIYIGDPNFGGKLLYFGSILAPFLAFFSLIKYIREKKGLWLTTGFWATVLVFQFLILLGIYDLIPFATWK